MKYSTKAASLSAFLFPGSGHIFLKCYLRGVLFIVIAAVGLYMFMEAAFMIALEIANDIEAGKVDFDIAAIRSVMEQSMGIYEQPELKGAKFAIIGSWLVSSLDAWREGRIKDKALVEK